MGISRAISDRLGVRPGAQRGDIGVVVAPLRDAVERRAAEAERRRAGRCLEKGVIHASSLNRSALAKRGKAGFNPCESFGR
jgi:phosphate starvation-inducible protein PhoH